MKIISTDSAPAAAGPYSQAVKAEKFVFSSGQLPVDPRTGAVVPGGIAAQTERAIENLKAVLESAGSSLEKTVKTTCFLKDMADFAEFNRVYAGYFTGKPARSCIEASALPRGVLIEIDAISATESE
ncbi:MAG: RidA family protein [Clostridia bacterium]|nr:RidA family protein [Clostridia bacterium]MBO7548534.1 RidA family protein [Clostridia bacterium]MBP5754712.1 RidA family protein [Clostridia bacterium]MBQ6043523.1 RidA family protein [Clostridia bacterium]MBQ6183030.1 RidA family protein [Clostridia bacterium]